VYNATTDDSYLGQVVRERVRFRFRQRIWPTRYEIVLVVKILLQDNTMCIMQPQTTVTLVRLSESDSDSDSDIKYVF